MNAGLSACTEPVTLLVKFVSFKAGTPVPQGGRSQRRQWSVCTLEPPIALSQSTLTIGQMIGMPCAHAVSMRTDGTPSSV